MIFVAGEILEGKPNNFVALKLRGLSYFKNEEFEQSKEDLLNVNKKFGGKSFNLF